MKRTTFLAALILTASCLHVAALPPNLLELRNRAYAELENEQPGSAEALYRELIALAPEDPLGHANLAIALLRQQSFEAATAAIDKALALDAEAPRLLAIKAEILQWSGDGDAALDFYRRAAELATSDVELQYALYRHLTTVIREPEAALIDATLERLVALRPENVLVLVQQGRRALAAGDRTTATGAFLRLGELIWQAPAGSDQLHQTILGALEDNQLEQAAIPSQRLENVLKITAMYREGLRELNTGIQGIPLTQLRGEPPVSGFGAPAEVSFLGQQLSTVPALGRGLAVGDFDGDQRPDVARLAVGDTAILEVAFPSKEGAPSSLALPLDSSDMLSLLASDLDNDGMLDLLGFGTAGARFWRGDGAGGLIDATDDLGLASVGGVAAAVIDFDIEGDLDLVLGGSGLELLRNSLSGALEAVGDKTLPAFEYSVSALVASDLDRDGDLDLAIATEHGLHWLDNLRQGQFVDRTEGSGLPRLENITALVAADLDNDGYPELIAAGIGVQVLHNDRGRFSTWKAASSLATSAQFSALVAFDADNDGRLDLAVAGPGGVAVAAQRGDGFGFLPIDNGPSAVTALAAADLDGDGDLDLVAQSADGLFQLTNNGGNSNHWLTVRLRGLTKGNSKNNVLGVGSVVEVKAGGAYQFREAAGDSVHFGLGALDRPDLLRVVWTNGVPQNRLDPAVDQWIVEEQLLKGSCPFLYVLADGELRFITDLLWNAPAGLPAAPGVWIPADPSELVKVGALAPISGQWELRITEELWEAAFFDLARLWVVDHPPGVEVASNLKVGAGPPGPDRILATREVQPLAGAWDAAGREVTEIVRHRDETYADGWQPSRYQGVTAEPWSFTMDLGRPVSGPIRLLLDGWIFPADASLNLAVAQQDDVVPAMPRLEVETANGWRTLVAATGHPAGKTKTMVVDTPPLAGAQRLRLVSGLWLSWDRIAWSQAPVDDSAHVVAKLDASRADLSYRGFSTAIRHAPNAPHAFDYSAVSTESPWLPFPGRYTRYGDVRELLATADDRSVIIAPGDEIRLLFDATQLPPPSPGWQRTLFLESHGWDKDADRNTRYPKQMEPLPFRAMTTYGEPFPRSALLDSYRRQWLTRDVDGGSSDPTLAESTP